MRHAARAAEPTRPGEVFVSSIFVAEGGELRIPAAPMMRIFMDVSVRVSWASRWQQRVLLIPRDGVACNEEIVR